MGPVLSTPAPQFEPGRNGTHTLRHPRIGQAGLSQQCRPDPEQHIWCAIAISNGAQVRILDIYVAADARHGGRRRLEVSFVGDLNRDGVFDLMFGWDSGGGVSCTAEYLFVSNQAQGGWQWPMAADSACD